MTLDKRRSGWNRRDFLVGGALAGLGASGALAACGGFGSSASTTLPATTTAEPVVAPPDRKTLRIATWPYYIENDAPATSTTIKNFTAATGYKVDYHSVLDDNFTFTEKYVRDLQHGTQIGFDIVVPTAWMCETWISQGWVEEIPASTVPNRTNLLTSLAHPSFDPDRKYTLPFTIGQVGIAYYPAKVGFTITSMRDFLRPELAGKASVLTEMRDTVGMFLLMAGVTPETATLDQMRSAVAEIKKYRDAGHFKSVTGNSYADDLKDGSLSAALAWSGDVATLQAERPDLTWVLPAEGAMSFVDTMIIPKGANMDAAAAWLNYLYDPAVSGPLFEAISYGSPVTGAEQHMSARGRANSLVVPQNVTKLHEFASLTLAEAGSINRAFGLAIA